jgi:anthranilate synthase component 1
VTIVEDAAAVDVDEYSLLTLKTVCTYYPSPLDLYRHLTQEQICAILLESADIQNKRRLRSVILARAAMRIECRGHDVSFKAMSDNGRNLLRRVATEFACFIQRRHDEEVLIRFPRVHEELDEDQRLRASSVFDALRLFLRRLSNATDKDAPLLVSGLFAYDLVANYEPLQVVPSGFNDCPDYLFYVAETAVTIDHQCQSTRIVSHVFPGEGALDISQALRERNRDIRTICERGVPGEMTVHPVAQDVSVSKSDAEFREMVATLKGHIEAGDVFQVVPSRSFFLPCPNPLGAYQVLRETNPSPYMFYLKSEQFVLFGASPESALKYSHLTNQVEIYPIAGTRRRGKRTDGTIDHDLDSRIELELRRDEKELAEHLMLVDLARNDISRISEPGSRSVPDLLRVDRYSHVMHLVSRVTGQLRNDLDALHAYQACMNMGTLVGAPKVRAAQLIRDVERQRRGSYGGAVGYLTSNGDMDTCIVIRSAFVREGMASIQAGAGVVFDSDPQAEADETRSKAQAVINAIVTGGGI